MEKRFSKSCHILVNNAGVMSAGTTANGYNSCFQVNFLGHVYLTMLLLPLMQESARKKGVESRVVFVNSQLHNFANPAVTAEAAAELRGDRFSTGYCESQLFSLLFLLELRRRKLKGIRAHAVNPGAVRSELWLLATRDSSSLQPACEAAFLESAGGLHHQRGRCCCPRKCCAKGSTVPHSISDLRRIYTSV